MTWKCSGEKGWYTHLGEKRMQKLLADTNRFDLCNIWPPFIARKYGTVLTYPPSVLCTRVRVLIIPKIIYLFRLITFLFLDVSDTRIFYS